MLKHCTELVGCRALNILFLVPNISKGGKEGGESFIIADLKCKSRDCEVQWSIQGHNSSQWLGQKNKNKQRLPAENLILTLYQGHWLEQRWPWVILGNGRAVPRGTNEWLWSCCLQEEGEGTCMAPPLLTLPRFYPQQQTLALFQPHLPIPGTLWASATSTVLLCLFSAHHYRKAKKIVNSTFP